MKIFISGSKGCGKSYLVNDLINTLGIKVSGFKTLPLIQQGRRIGFYYHSLIDIDGNDQRFSIQYSDRNEVIKGVFNDLGCRCLRKSLQKNTYVIMDEIGYLEHDEQAYLTLLLQIINSAPCIIGVLRKCDISYIKSIRNRSDIIYLDLDHISYEDARKFIIERIGEKNEVN